MMSRIPFLLIAILLLSLPCLARERVQLPPEFKENTELDQGSNIALMQPLDDESRAIVPIFHIDVPVEDVSFVHISQFLDDATRNNSLIRKGGKVHVRFFFNDKDDPIYVAAKSVVGEEPQTYWGTKMQSHNTYFVWTANPSDRFYVKFPVVDGTTWPRTVQNAVNVNDYVETVLNEEPEDGFVSVMPERFAATLIVEGVTYSYSMRSAVPNRVPPNLNGAIKMRPLHGFLGSPKLKEAARRRGMSERTWIVRELIPKLAKFLARANFRYGLYPMAHTQNLQIFVDERTGEIIGFSFRDLNDTAIDPFMRVIRGRPAHFSSVRGSKYTSRLHRVHAGGALKDRETAKHSFGPGWINGSYLGYWNLFHLSVDQGFTQFLLDEFFRSFIPEVENETGIKLDRSKLPPSYAKSFGPGVPGYDLFQAIYEQVVDGLTRNVELHARKYNQRTLAMIFERHYSETMQVALLRPQARQEYIFKENWGFLFESWMEFTFDGTNIIAFNRETGQIMAYAYGLDDTERSMLQASEMKPEKKKASSFKPGLARQRCEAIF